MRVTTFSQSQFLVNEMGRAINSEAKSAAQAATGFKGETYRDLEGQTGVLISSRRTLERVDQFKKLNTQIKLQIDRQDLALVSMENASKMLHKAVLDAISTGKGINLMKTVDTAFKNAVSALNTSHNGKYVFSGTRINTKPVPLERLADLEDPATVADAFKNNSVKFSAMISEGNTLEYGVLASEVGADFMTELKAIIQYNKDHGPFDNNLTDGQKTFLRNRLIPLQAMEKKSSLHTAHNGVNRVQITYTEDILKKTDTALKLFVSDIEHVDMSAVVAQLAQDKLAVQAAMRMVAGVGRMTLLNYLR